jgi:hypothetical protein
MVVVIWYRLHLQDKVTSSTDTRFENLVVVNINSVVYWSVTPYSLVFTSILEEHTVLKR